MGSPVKPGTVEELVDEHYLALYRYAYRLTGSDSDAEDLTQETFCKAHHKRDQLREPARAKAWLFSILRNAYLHRLRAQRQQRFVSLEALGDLAEPLPEPLPPIDPVQLQDALQELSEVYRTPLILYYFEDFSYRDIAEQMELPLGTVMSRLARAKAYLRSRLLPQAAPLGANHSRRDADGL
jgi:RNA polymerase sigma-70 factor (ECF subfamily)